MLHPYIVCSKNVLIKSLKGSMSAKNVNVASIRIGFGDVQVIDHKYTRSIWDTYKDSQIIIGGGYTSLRVQR